MPEKHYIILRKLFFWIFTILFLIFAPYSVYYSLGYKFNPTTKKFMRTAILSIDSQPQEAKVFLNGKDSRKCTPSIFRNLHPGKYHLLIEKEGFYPYKIDIEISPNSIKEINAILIPSQKDIEKISYDFCIYGFFPLSSFLNTKFLVFTDEGVFLIDKNLEKVSLLTEDILDKSIVDSIKGLLPHYSLFLIWNENNIYMLKDKKLNSIYTAKEVIKKVLWGFRKRYILIQDGLKIIAQDIEEPSVRIEILGLNSINAQVYYSSLEQALYVKDKLVDKDTFSLFKISLKSFLFKKGIDLEQDNEHKENF